MRPGRTAIPRLLFPQLSAFGLLDGFRVDPVPAGRSAALGAVAIAERALELDTRPDSPAVRAAREAVGMLAAEAAAGTDLAALCLVQLLGPVRAKRAEGAGARTLYGLLTRTGLHPAEAGRLAVSVLAESAVAPDPLVAVTTLLADGRLQTAQQAADAVSGPAGEAARTAVHQQRAEVDRLRAAAAEHLRAGDHERAGERLRAALRLAGDHPELAAELEQVPAAAVSQVRAVPDGYGVRISWRPAAEHGADTAYRVLRGRIEGGAGRPPADPADGDEIVPGPVAGQPVAIDAEPPVGRRLCYAVFARHPGGSWSHPAGAGVGPLLPPVAELRVAGDTGLITGSWRPHPATSAVEVLRYSDGPGQPVGVHDLREFSDETVADGIRYRYAVVAQYPPVEPGGPVLRAEPVCRDAATRPEPRPLRALTAAALIGPDELGVRLSWRQPAGSEIVIRWAAQPCPWPYGQLVPAAELAGYGQLLTGQRREHGDAVSLQATLPAGWVHCVPFTIGPGGGLRGQDAVAELLRPVHGVRVQRFGEDLLVSWAWPDAAGAAEVRWAGGHRRITPSRYREEGGCRLPAAAGVTRVEVSALLPGADDVEGRAPAVAVTVPARPPRIDYQLRRRGHRLTGGARCEVTLVGAEPVGEVTVLLIAAPGPVMPGSPAVGRELLRAQTSLKPGVPVQLDAPLPALPRPYWLRLFLPDPAPALLVDPPVDQLKVT